MSQSLGDTFLIGDSVGFGQAEPDSDLDIASVGPDLPHFRQRIQTFQKRHSVDPFSWTIDLDLVASALEDGGLPSDKKALEQFMGFAWICRHRSGSFTSERA